MQFSVIIPTLNHLSDCLKPCCESIIRNTTLNKNIEIIIVGNGCTDGTKEYVKSLGKPFVYLNFDQPLGYAKANNEGLKIAKGDYLILLNNDTIILDWAKNTWLTLLVEAFKKNPKCGISGPSLGYSGPADANFLIFFCVMISRKCFRSVGYLDEEFKEGGGEDTAYCIEAKKKGFDLVQVPSDSLWVQKDYMVGAFPIYHAGEKTVHGLKNWDEIFKRNSDILLHRYNRRWILSNNTERIIYGKGHQLDQSTIDRYSWVKKNIYGSKILEIGCSSGHGTQFLKDINNLDYLGIDYSADVIQYAQENFGDQAGVKFIHGDINTFDLDQYDTIVCLEVLEHIDNGKEIVQKLKKHCKRFLICVPYNENPDEGSPHHKLKNLTASDFPLCEDYQIVQDAVTSNLKHLMVKWSDPEILKNLPKEDVGVTAIISTKNRHYTTLPMAIMSICNQSVKPKHLIIYDDGEIKPNLDKDPIYSKLFATISASGISWEYKYGRKIGQVANHIQSIKNSPTQFIWRLDDDNVADYNVLEGLLKCVTDDVGAVGGLIINEYSDVPSIASNKIEDIYLGINEQWFFHSKDSKPKEVDHLYSSFIYRKSIAEYPENLSSTGFREETILTYEIKRKGYKVILNPSVKTWHFNSPSGGIRSESTENNIIKDSNIFTQKLNSWGIKPNDYSFVVLEHGLGDHFAFKSILPQYLKTFKNKKHIFFVCFPDVFRDIPDIKLASIADAKKMFGNIERFDLYKFIMNERWNKGLPLAYKKIYNIKDEVIKGRFGNNDIKKGTGKNIIISPYSFNPQHPKSYIYWKKLISLLKKEGYKITQIGKSGEEKIKGINDYLFDASFKDLEKRILSCKLWISGDNFLQHFVNSLNTPIKGVVIWGMSDPKIFGYHYNANILKSEKYLRKFQVAPWNIEKQNAEVFEKPEVIFNVVKKLIQ